MKILKSIWSWTLGHPFTWDVLAAVAAYTSASAGWFKPWVPCVFLGYLLVRIFLLRGEIARIKH